MYRPRNIGNFATEILYGGKELLLSARNDSWSVSSVIAKKGDSKNGVSILYKLLLWHIHNGRSFQGALLVLQTPNTINPTSGAKDDESNQKGKGFLRINETLKRNQ